ncbi:hypothetical protein BS78_06G023700 [Paspalum vaginatum]|nr:hypothetical protein BS78_06G023100 [Paspalum vaginatum]KAJ1270036.1 hypothetical protein BS78_06G023700 [Paspalum vaginatum]
MWAPRPCRDFHRALHEHPQRTTSRQQAPGHLPRRPSMASSPSARAPAVLPVRLRQPAAVAARARAAPVLPPALRSVSSGGGARRGAALVASPATDGLRRRAIGDYPEGVLSGDWPEDFSLLNDADLLAYLESRLVTSDQMSPGARLLDVMSRPVQVATPGQRLAEVDAFFAAHQYSGLPVVDEEEGRCVGVISEKDKAKAPNGMESTVGEVMSSPAITLTPEKIVLEAAALMLKEKVHRIPVVNEQNIVIGIVTRTDVFQALESNSKA